jgi:ABC-2 type transport system permease protein
MFFEIKRYLRLYGQFLSFSFGKAAAYRFDFWCRILMDIAYYMVGIGFFKIIFLSTGTLAGWTEQQVMVFVGANLVLDAIQMTFISGNIWEMPSIINRGELDNYITKPVSTLFFLCFHEIAVGSFINLAIAASFFAWALNNYPEPFTFLRLFSFFIFMGFGFLIYFAMRLLVALPVFWTQSPYGLERIFYSMMPLMERPDVLFRGPLRAIILTVLPFALVVSFPARVFFEGITWQIALHMLIVLIVAWRLVFWVWNKGVTSYASASS